MKKLLLGVAMAAALAIPAHAMVVIDRDYTDNTSQGIAWNPIYSNPQVWGGDTSVFYQSFTVGVTGTFAGVKIEGPSSSPLFPATGSIEVQLLSGGGLDGGFYRFPSTVLGTSWIQPSAMPSDPFQGAYADFLSQGIAVTSGEALTFAFASVSEYMILEGGLVPGAYGTRSDVNYPGTALMTTYVDNGASPASAVPEPSTWAMMLTGFAALSYAAFRRAKRPRLAI
jgi:opacity protein-like surface antigen